MKVGTFKPDDPALAQLVAKSAQRVSVPAENRPPAPYHPSFGDYVAGKLDSITEEKTMAERGKKDEVVTLPDGRQIQIQAKGAPVVEALADRERELAQSAIDAEKDVDHLREIQPDPGTKALGITGNEKIVDDKGALGTAKK
jgi:hypothetical protein